MSWTDAPTDPLCTADDVFRPFDDTERAVVATTTAGSGDAAGGADPRAVRGRAGAARGGCLTALQLRGSDADWSDESAVWISLGRIILIVPALAPPRWWGFVLDRRIAFML